MNKSETKKPPAPETGAKGPEGQKETPTPTILSLAAAIKLDQLSAEASLEIQTETVIDLFRSPKDIESTEAEPPKESVLINPEETVSNLTGMILREPRRDRNLDEISLIMLVSDRGIREVKSWLAGNQAEIRDLAEEIKKLEAKKAALAARQAEAEERNFLIRLWQKRKRQKLKYEANDVSFKLKEFDWIRRQKQDQDAQLRSDLEKFLIKRRELPFDAVKILFKDVAAQRREQTKILAASGVKRALDEVLVGQQVVPELEKIQAEGRLSQAEAAEYLALLKDQLAEGHLLLQKLPEDKITKIEARNKRLDELHKITGFRLNDVTSLVNADGNEPADTYYDSMVDLLARQIAKEKIEQLRDRLNAPLDPAGQEWVEYIAEKAIDPTWHLRPENNLDLTTLPIEYFSNLQGMKRWPLLRDFFCASGLVPKEIFDRVERVMIQRLAEEKLLPGGGESWEGTNAANLMGNLGNPEALPLLLRQIETFGGGHTNSYVTDVMRKLLKAGEPEARQKVLASLPAEKKRLFEIMADENSYLNRFAGNDPYRTCHLLKEGQRTVRQERYTKLLAENKTPEEELRDFYLLAADRETLLKKLEQVAKLAGEDEKEVIYDYIDVLASDVTPNDPDSLKSIDRLADKLKAPKAELLVYCLDLFERPPRNPTLKRVTSPANKDYAAFPLALAKTLLNLNEGELEKLAEIYSTKGLQTSGLEREFFLEGLILLKNKGSGQADMQTLLGAYRGAKDDPKRMRRSFQLLSVMEGFGEYGLVRPPAEKMEEISRELAALEAQLPQTADKAEKKKIKNRIETLNREGQNLSGLKGIETSLTEKVVDIACRRLDLPEEYRQKIEANLEELLQSGLFEIVPTLAGNYEGKNESQVKALLKTITVHIIDGDFSVWRYAHERSGSQLEGLTAEQKAFWQKNLEPVVIETELDAELKSRRADELKTAQEMVRNAKEHILVSQPDFNFSEPRSQTLEAGISELTEKIKASATEEEKKRLATEKRTLEVEAALIAGIREIEQTTPQKFSRERIISQARQLAEIIEQLRLPLAGLDLEQIEKIFTVGDIKSVVAYEADDPLTLLKIGIEPQETCQSWRKGGFNECLLAYVADSNKKVINVTDGEGKVVARSVIKLTRQRPIGQTGPEKQRTTLLAERPYAILHNTEVFRAFFKLLLTKAQGLEAAIALGSSFSKADLKIFQEEEAAFGYGQMPEEAEIYIPASLNKYEYSDALGGKISSFDRFQRLAGTTFDKISKIESVVDFNKGTRRKSLAVPAGRNARRSA